MQPGDGTMGGRQVRRGKAVRVLPLLLLALLGLCPSAHAQQRLSIHGSNTIGETLAPMLLRTWLAARGAKEVSEIETGFEERRFLATLDGEPLEIELHAHGSSTAFEDLLDGSADIGMASRAVKPAEVAAGRSRLGRLDAPAQETVIALDGLSVIVHRENPVQALSVAQVQAIFSGRIRDWRAVGGRPGRIVLHARDERSGTWDTFRNLVLKDAGLASSARRYESTAGLSAAVSADPRAIGFVGLVGVGRARALAVSDGGAALRPDRFEVAVEDYALARRLYFYTPEAPSALARDFIAFVLSGEGQAVVDAAGFVSQEVRAYAPRPDSGLPVEYAAAIAGARRLSLNFRFGTGSSFLDGKALHDVARLAAFMLRPENRGAQLRLLGFADAVEYLPLQAILTSSDRADVIAARLAGHGVAVHRVRGFGGSVQVAGNGTAHGRYRNRRVEVWIAP